MIAEKNGKYKIGTLFFLMKGDVSYFDPWVGERRVRIKIGGKY